MSSTVRTEKDFLGQVEIPEDHLYGVNAKRASHNFRTSNIQLGEEPFLIRAFSLIKKACARANHEFGILSDDQTQALAQACEEVGNGELNRHFIVDLLEGSGGTSLNMNVNEVLANRALKIMGHKSGQYEFLHPNDHVNISQSTNDVVPSAIDVACHNALGPLLLALRELQEAFASKAAQFRDILKLGRTCLQDAQPMALGQEFGAYASLTGRCSRELERCQDSLRVLPLGGTAIGTGLGAPRGFGNRALKHLTDITGVEWRAPADSFDAMQSADGYARLSSELKTCAISLGKIAQDLILMSSGPTGGLGEINLPPLQKGSSIMPGKVNPVQPMSMVQVACSVAGNDLAISMACEQGQLEINPYEPLIALKLFDSMRLLTNGITSFTRLCIHGIEANVDHMRDKLLRSSAIATALVPELGYERVAALVRQAQSEGRTFIEVAEKNGNLKREHVISIIKSTA